MQERILDLLVVVENEDVTAELIQVNEDLNNAILGCERWAVGSLSDRPPGLGTPSSAQPSQCLPVGAQKD